VPGHAFGIKPLRRIVYSRVAPARAMSSLARKVAHVLRSRPLDGSR
jgi:hypothetical protein